MPKHHLNISATLLIVAIASNLLDSHAVNESMTIHITPEGES